ncbi:Hypothetical predicted protein [Octopus vulgaris]|uniref:Uncharacterized protein n=1 Tax=Octopus vulgaris TaxID=6645 RepID=A0AA36BD10_OCTVU|nr:Hypothetical predicted protein [Octopus vulgaris]
MAAPIAVQMNLHPTMNLDADDIVEAFKKFKQKTQLAFKSFLKGTTANGKYCKDSSLTTSVGPGLIGKHSGEEEEDGVDTEMAASGWAAVTTTTTSMTAVTHSSVVSLGENEIRHERRNQRLLNGTRRVQNNRKLFRAKTTVSSKKSSVNPSFTSSSSKGIFDQHENIPTAPPPTAAATKPTSSAMSKKKLSGSSSTSSSGRGSFVRQKKLPLQTASEENAANQTCRSVDNSFRPNDSNPHILKWLQKKDKDFWQQKREMKDDKPSELANKNPVSNFTSSQAETGTDVPLDNPGSSTRFADCGVDQNKEELEIASKTEKHNVWQMRASLQYVDILFSKKLCDLRDLLGKYVILLIKKFTKTAKRSQKREKFSVNKMCQNIANKYLQYVDILFSKKLCDLRHLLASLQYVDILFSKKLCDLRDLLGKYVILLIKKFTKTAKS